MARCSGRHTLHGEEGAGQVCGPNSHGDGKPGPACGPKRRTCKFDSSQGLLRGMLADVVCVGHAGQGALAGLTCMGDLTRGLPRGMLAASFCVRCDSAKIPLNEAGGRMWRPRARSHTTAVVPKVAVGSDGSHASSKEPSTSAKISTMSRAKIKFLRREAKISGAWFRSTDLWDMSPTR